MSCLFWSQLHVVVVVVVVSALNSSRHSCNAPEHNLAYFTFETRV
jgi:hypothetical protein